MAIAASTTNYWSVCLDHEMIDKLKCRRIIEKYILTKHIFTSIAVRLGFDFVDLIGEHGQNE
jgi:hypothetical protein